MNSIRSRIAPTPSGLLHIGNLYSFILTWLIARSQKGKLLLRIDDMDGPRVRGEYIDDIFETLDYVELTYDEGPVDANDFLQNYSQHLRMTQYYDLLSRLKDTGLVYACTCSRKQVRHDGATACNCSTKNIPLNTAEAAWKIRVLEKTMIGFKDGYKGNTSIDLTAEMGDFVIRRKDGLPAYQVVSLADDLFFDVNVVVRGEDLLPSTAAQLYLAEITGNNAFIAAQFFHHPLVKNTADQKLSKSAGAGSIKAMRESGMLAVTLLNSMREMPCINLHAPVNDLHDLLSAFSADLK